MANFIPFRKISDQKRKTLLKRLFQSKKILFIIKIERIPNKVGKYLKKPSGSKIEIDLDRILNLLSKG